MKLVNHGAGLAGSTIDMYIPNSYLSVGDLTELRITKDFLYETDDYKFCVSDDVIFKSNSLCIPDKYIGEANVPNMGDLKVIETDVRKIEGTNGAGTVSGDTFFSFYLTENDYPTEGDVNWTGTNDFLKNINYYDYILIDGVKMGTLWNSAHPGEKFTRVWGRQDAWSTRWPNAINNDTARAAVQEIKILAGCQFPSAKDPSGTVYEVKKDITLVRTSEGVFINDAYLLTEDDITIGEATVVGEQSEMFMFEFSFDGWSSTRDTYDFNYFGDQFVNMRKNILINGVSLYDINTTVDDSGYNYATSPWTDDKLAPGSEYQLFQNPTLIRGEGNKLMVYVHKQYLADTNANTVEVTIKNGFKHSG